MPAWPLGVAAAGLGLPPPPPPLAVAAAPLGGAGAPPPPLLQQLLLLPPPLEAGRLWCSTAQAEAATARPRLLGVAAPPKLPPPPRAAAARGVLEAIPAADEGLDVHTPLPAAALLPRRLNRGVIATLDALPPPALVLDTTLAGHLLASQATFPEPGRLVVVDAAAPPGR